MGFLRFLLAISVVQEHAGTIFGYRILSGAMAVRFFFIISGFYIAFILNEKYKNQSHRYWLFISNRFLRIYPLYWLILFLTITFIYFFPETGYYVLRIPFFISLIKNFTLFITTDYFVYIPKLYGEIYVYQAWTLGIELLFYLIAPFVAFLSSKKIFLLTCISLAMRLFVTHSDIFYPIKYMDRFFITQLCFFFLGMLAFKAYQYLKKRNYFSIIAKYFFYTTLLITFLFPFIPSPNIFADNKIQWLYFLTMTASLPGIFYSTKNSKLDRFLGNLSYPIYISHTILLDCIRTFFPEFKSSTIFTISIIILTILFSITLEEFFLKPIEKFRQNRVKKI